MKQLVLTGMATEHDFSNQREQYMLVFNKGELRVPVSEEAAQEVIKVMYGDGQPQQTGFTREEIEEAHQQLIEEETRARPKPPESNGIVMAPVGSTYSEDDGVDQV